MVAKAVDILNQGLKGQSTVTQRIIGWYTSRAQHCHNSENEFLFEILVEEELHPKTFSDPAATQLALRQAQLERFYEITFCENGITELNNAENTLRSAISRPEMYE